MMTAKRRNYIKCLSTSCVICSHVTIYFPKTFRTNDENYLKMCLSIICCIFSTNCNAIRGGGLTVCPRAARSKEVCFISEGFLNWKKALARFKEHQVPECHKIAIDYEMIKEVITLCKLILGGSSNKCSQ